MNDPINFVDNDKIELFNRLNANNVRYMAFGSFSINAYEQARTDSTIKLWIDPAQDNITKLNTAFQESGRKPIAREFNPESTKPLKSETGPPTRDSLGVDFYPTVNGFQSTDFARVYDRKTIIKAHEFASKTTNRALLIDHMALPDLYHNVGSTNGKAKEYNLDVLFKAASAFDVPGQKIAEPSTYLAMDAKNKPKPVVNFSKGKQFKPDYQRRDFAQIRQELDMELVLQHYGYQMSSKSKPNDKWRIYKSGIEGDSQRLAVMNNSEIEFKGFVDLNNTAFKGDVFSFIKYREGDYKNAFRVVDQILGSPDYREKAAQLQPMKPVSPRQYLNDEKLRQSDLIEEYNLTLLPENQPNYLTEKRCISMETLFAPEFKNQVLASRRDEHTNIVFPLTSEKGNILSMDIRNENFKSFPPGQKGESIWKSNEHAQLTVEKDVLVGDSKIRLDKETRGTVSKSNGRLTFHTVHPNEGNLSVEIEKSDIRTTTNRIMISESPIDSISYHMLSPPVLGEYRQYISTAGNPSHQQLEQVSKIIKANPQAQFMIGMDGNMAGNRFAINLLAIEHPRRDNRLAILPHVVYNNPTPAIGAGGNDLDAKEVGHNVMTIEIKHPLSKEAGFRTVLSENGGIIDRVVDKMNRFERIGKRAVETRRENLVEADTNIVRTVTEIRFPNKGSMLGAALHQLGVEIERRDGRKLTDMVKPTPAQNDFNDVLKSRNGKSLPSSSNLYLGTWSLLSFLQPAKTSHLIPLEERNQQNHKDFEEEGPPKRKGPKL
jgi:hypothetical protein